MDLEKKDEQPLRSVAVPVTDDQSRKRKRRKRIICCASVIGVILTIALVMLILSLTVFKAKKPVLTVNSVSLEDLNFSITPIPPSASLNLSLALQISIDNPNKVSIKYQTSSAALRYRGKDIGNVPVPAGKLGSDDTTRLNLTLTVFADRLASDTDLYRDLIGGNLPLTTYTKMKAKVKVLFINIHVTSTSTCDVNIDLQSRSIPEQTCHYKNKI